MLWEMQPQHINADDVHVENFGKTLPHTPGLRVPGLPVSGPFRSEVLMKSNIHNVMKWCVIVSITCLSQRSFRGRHHQQHLFLLAARLDMNTAIKKLVDKK